MRQTAEAGSFDAVFFADGLNYGPPATWAYKTTEDFEPLTTTAALSAVTERIGLVVTGSATLQHPYHLARQLLSLDHLSLRPRRLEPRHQLRRGRGRQLQRPAASSTTTSGTRIAEEAIDVVKKLWDSWSDATVVEDRDTGIFNDVSGIHVPNHRGRYFDVKGPLGAARSPQGHPSSSRPARRRRAGPSPPGTPK